ncbi:unnamed protein product [Dibothriocephalus latus]|uniref:Uncharacterized protein n=1 Tax=Dibothriocephalus latus TaxID=60516 RepID=A0A3P7N5F6_DIBLA|nr:unnamed protein product [Dibothriocephalus latus]
MNLVNRACRHNSAQSDLLVAGVSGIKVPPNTRPVPRLSTIVFLLEDSISTALRKQKARTPLNIPCAPNQAHEFLTGCVACEQSNADPSCKPTGYNARVKCEGAASSSLISCNPAEFSDRALERRHFLTFECFMAVIGSIAYFLIRRQQRLLDKQLMDRINKQIAS